MPMWLWIIVVVTGIFALLLFLFRVHYSIAWEGGFNFSAMLDYGFPGFKRVWKFPSEKESQPLMEREEPDLQTAASEETSASTANQKQKEPSRAPSSKPRFDRTRAQRALFLFVTSPAVIRSLIGYSLRSLGLIFKLLHLELNLAISRSNPAQLGRLAGYWYATKPFIPTRHVNVEFHFEDPKSSLRLQARGGFSAAQALACLFVLIGSFPWFLLVKKAWRSWRNPMLRGWRLRVFGWMR